MLIAIMRDIIKLGVNWVTRTTYFAMGYITVPAKSLEREEVK